MIKIKNDNKKITIEGHANYSDTNDIVCASVSSIMYTTVNAIMNFNEKAIMFTDNKEMCTIEIKIEDDITIKLIDNMMLMFKSLESKYPSNIEIK